ncbi:MAG: hypothetical protein IJ867_00690 [Clostridia bacterium]|nr:hypothetical protein [Clostridia bacterium]
MKETGGGRAKRDGIVFRSTVVPHLCVDAIRNEEGEISTIVFPEVLVDLLEAYGTLHDKNYRVKMTKKVIVTIDILLIVLSFLTRHIPAILAAVYFSLLLSKDLFEFLELSYQMKSKNGAERSTAKYHAAEHMVLNAFRDLKRVPTLEEIKHYSRFSEYCGSMEFIDKFTIHGLTSLLIALSGLFPLSIHIFICIAYLLILLFCNTGKVTKFLQVAVTTPPTDLELEVAIEGLSSLEEFDNELEKALGDETDDIEIELVIHRQEDSQNGRT